VPKNRSATACSEIMSPPGLNRGGYAAIGVAKTDRDGLSESGAGGARMQAGLC
jgi:hypothetical protein